MYSNLLSLLFVSLLVANVTSHSHHLHNPHKERAEDGGRSGRDHHHFQNGEHNPDFDHESILGENSFKEFVEIAIFQI